MLIRPILHSFPQRHTDSTSLPSVLQGCAWGRPGTGSQAEPHVFPSPSCELLHDMPSVFQLGCSGSYGQYLRFSIMRMTHWTQRQVTMIPQQPFSSSMTRCPAHEGLGKWLGKWPESSLRLPCRAWEELGPGWASPFSPLSGELCLHVLVSSGC